MKYLYVDNFRGFDNTFIPIQDVNFLVGENSTGKSSILSLINLLGDPKFWYKQEFNNSEVELGTFKDIININSKNKKYFRIGVVECREDDDFPTNSQNTFLMTFEEESGAPKLRKYNFVASNKSIRLIFLRETVRFKFSDISPEEGICTTLMEIFKSWLKEDPYKTTGYKIFKPKGDPSFPTIAFPFMKGIFERIALGETEGEMDMANLFNFEIPIFAQSLVWIAPIRTKPARIYGGLKLAFSPEGEHTPLLIKHLLSKEKTKLSFSEYVKNFGADSGLFDDVYTKAFGRGFASPFELRIVLNEKKLRVSEVGYGVSQSLPVIVELFARKGAYNFAIQQPEVHLHPKAQAALGNLFMDLAINEHMRFFVETHSDYTINRFRIRCRENDKAKKISSQVLFFERNFQGNQVFPISIQENGQYSENQPESFREFFINEELRVLRI